MILTKKLIHVGTSQAVILPKTWLQQYGEIEEVLLDVNGKIVITPVLIKCVQNNIEAKKE